MQIIDEVEEHNQKLLYHEDTNEYEVIFENKSKRFPALYVPVFGPDVDDMNQAEQIAAELEKEWNDEQIRNTGK